MSIAHQAGLKVTAHSYGEQGDCAALRGGVDRIEHLVNVPHPLSDALIAKIVREALSSVRRSPDRLTASGTVAPGKLADAVLVRGNPLEDIEALASVEFVLKEGPIVYIGGNN